MEPDQEALRLGPAARLAVSRSVRGRVSRSRPGAPSQAKRAWPSPLERAADGPRCNASATRAFTSDFPPYPGGRVTPARRQSPGTTRPEQSDARPLLSRASGSRPSPRRFAKAERLVAGWWGAFVAPVLARSGRRAAGAPEAHLAPAVASLPVFAGTRT